MRTDTKEAEISGQLYMWMKEVIEITQPKIFIAENVKGLVNLGGVKSIIQNDFSFWGVPFQVGLSASNSSLN